MVRSLLGVLFGVMVAGVMANASSAAEMKTIATQKTNDVVVTVQSESGHWTKGKNSFVLEITSAKDKQPVDAGKVTLSTSMTMSGMPPMIAGATLEPDKSPGRYRGTHRVPGRRNSAGDDILGWSGGEGFDEVVRSRPLTHAGASEGPHRSALAVWGCSTSQ